MAGDWGVRESELSHQHLENRLLSAQAETSEYKARLARMEALWSELGQHLTGCPPFPHLPHTANPWQEAGRWAHVLHQQGQHEETFVAWYFRKDGTVTQWQFTEADAPAGAHDVLTRFSEERT